MGNTEAGAPSAEVLTESSTERIYQAIKDLQDRGRIATRQVLVTMTGLPMTIIDDRLKFLCSIGRVRRPVNGVFEADDVGEERATSATVLPNGRVKLEIGEHVLELSPREFRNIGALGAGFTLQFRG